jgi:predicted DNA-binding WGR domain protein
MIKTICYLEAQNPDKNLLRFYKIDYEPKSIDRYCVYPIWGRQKKPGKGKIFEFNTLEECLKFILKTIQKRLNSYKRIGCKYEFIPLEKLEQRAGHQLSFLL